MITGFPNLKTAADSVRLGAFDYISKPVNKETLLRFVRQALQHWDLEQEKKTLRNENERYRRYLQVIFSSVSDGIITVDGELKVVQYNEAASCLLEGVDRSAPIYLEALKGEVAQACLQDARSVIKSRRTVSEHHVECHIQGGNKRMVSLTAAPLRDENEEFDGAVIVIRDITLGVPENSIAVPEAFMVLLGQAKRWRRSIDSLKTSAKSTPLF